jgi:hypothetical protein
MSEQSGLMFGNVELLRSTHQRGRVSAILLPSSEYLLNFSIDQFELDYQFAVPYDGEVIGAFGHLHDGGVKTQFHVDNKLVCDNIAKYGTTPEYISPSELDSKGSSIGGQGHSHSGPAKHISEMKTCPGQGSLPMKKGQTWKFKALYDFEANQGMRTSDGEWDEVMGIGVLYVRIKG